MTSSRASLTLACFGLLATAASAADPPSSPDATLSDDALVASGKRVMLYFGGGYTRIFDTDLDGGEYEVDRFDARAGLRMRLTDDLSLNLRLGYELSDYEFSGDTGFAALQPWDDIHTLGGRALFALDLNNDLTLWGGPLIQFSRESGADWDESLNAGGAIGLTWEASEDFSIGGGVSLVSQIEDDVKFLPVIIIDWQISETLRLMNRGGASSSGYNGLELIWTFADPFEVALGAAWDIRRFRLDDDNVAAPGGVGEDEDIPVWLRLSCNVNNNFSIDLFGGITFGAELELENADGLTLATVDADPALFAGAAFSLRF